MPGRGQVLYGYLHLLLQLYLQLQFHLLLLLLILVKYKCSKGRETLYIHSLVHLQFSSAASVDTIDTDTTDTDTICTATDDTDAAKERGQG